MADKLTIKQEKYAQGLFAGLSQREAYKQAYDAENMTDKSIDEKACELAGNVKIQSRIKELTDELKERNMVTVERVLAELAKVGFANGSDFARVIEKTYIEKVFDEEGNETDQIEKKYKTVEIMATDDIDKDKLPAIAGIKSTRDGIEVKTNDKIKALELMGKHLGMFTDKIESVNHNINEDLDKLPENERHNRIRESMGKLSPEQRKRIFGDE
jgi:phage terminase small subunit